MNFRYNSFYHFVNQFNDVSITCIICSLPIKTNDYFLTIHKKHFNCCSHDCLIKVKNIYNSLIYPTSNPKCILCNQYYYNDSYLYEKNNKKIIVCSLYCLEQLKNIIKQIN